MVSLFDKKRVSQSHRMWICKCSCFYLHISQLFGQPGGGTINQGHKKNALALIKMRRNAARKFVNQNVVSFPTSNIDKVTLHTLDVYQWTSYGIVVTMLQRIMNNAGLKMEVWLRHVIPQSMGTGCIWNRLEEVLLAEKKRKNNWRWRRNILELQKCPRQAWYVQGTKLLVQK